MIFENLYEVDGEEEGVDRRWVEEITGQDVILQECYTPNPESFSPYIWVTVRVTILIILL